MWLFATLAKIPPGVSSSLKTFSLDLIAINDLVVGIFTEFINSLITYSLSTGPKADLPSPLFEKGV